MLAALTRSFSALRLQKGPVYSYLFKQTSHLATNSKRTTVKAIPKKPAKAIKKPAVKPIKKQAVKAKKVVNKPAKVVIPPAPTRSQNSLNLFFKENYEKIQDNNLSNTEAFQAVVKEFKQLSPTQLQDLKERAAKNSALLAEKFDAWKKALTSQQIAHFNSTLKKKGKRGKLVDPNQPKRPESAFISFFREVRTKPEFEGLSVPEAGKLIGQNGRI
ncbi:hypothetical protein DSO57_1008330 [Entomophthora muscae]|uniref:Uncharacterized protein n=1 Tax=Entomophthora muscae TaxID=34485 RepID=A0ACC2RLW4_9FUNG|nr:hypothetical protein DSO57_1008330 [Entomophthora muscae]